MVTAPLSHVVLGTNCLVRAEAFYAPLLAMLGWRRRPSDVNGDKLLWQPATAARPLFGVITPFNGEPHRPGNGGMAALSTCDRATVDAAYTLALSLGASCEGAPGLRPQYHPHFYGAYFRDPEGNKLCIVCHLPPALPEAGEFRLTRDAMIEHARTWIAAWNRRDVEAVIASFHPDCTFHSPVAEKVTGRAQITGAQALRSYWEQALAGTSELRFTLLDVICDELRQAMTVHYLAEIDGVSRRAVELFRFSGALKWSGEALYSCFE